MQRAPEYWRNQRIYLQLIGSKCKECGKVYFPPRPYCANCGSRNLEEYKLPETGKLLAWTVVRSPPKEFEEYAPYILGFIELDDGTRIIAQITDVDINNLKKGMRVRAVVRRGMVENEDGIIRYIYKFVPE